MKRTVFLFFLTVLLGIQLIYSSEISIGQSPSNNAHLIRCEVAPSYILISSTFSNLIFLIQETKNHTYLVLETMESVVLVKSCVSPKIAGHNVL